MKKTIQLTLLIVLIGLTLAHSTSQVSAQSTYPEVLETELPFQNTFYKFNGTNNNMTVQRTFSIKEFRDVTFADVLLEQSGQLVHSVIINLQLNGVNATTSHTESNLFDQEQILFILDEQAMIVPKTTNVLTFFITVQFNKPAVWQYMEHQHYEIRFDSIKIKTAYRQQIDVSSSQLNQSNSQFTAVIMDPSYQLATQGVLLGNKSNVGSLFAYDLSFYLIMPKTIKSNYYLNVTFTFNLDYSIRASNIDQFGLVASHDLANGNGISYTFRYISNQANPPPIVSGVLKFNPKNSGKYNVGIVGNYFITDSYKLFPGGPEMDFFLFINASIILPVLFLSKFLYRRLFY